MTVVGDEGNLKVITIRNRGPVTTAYTSGFMTKSPAGWLPRNLDQLRAQRSYSSMGLLYFWRHTKCL